MEEALNGKLSRGRPNSEARALVAGMVGDVYQFARGYEQKGVEPAAVERGAGFLAGSIDAILILLSQSVGADPIGAWEHAFRVGGMDEIRRLRQQVHQQVLPLYERKRPNAAARDELRAAYAAAAGRPGELARGYATGLAMATTTLGDLDCGNPMIALAF